MALNFKIRLWHKGVFLIALLLVVELSLMAGLWRMLVEAEREAQVAIHAEEIATTASVLTECYFKVGSNLAIYLAVKSEKYSRAVDKARAEIPGKFARLKALLQDDPSAIHVLEPLEKSLAACEVELALLKEKVTSGEDYDERQVRRKILPHVKNIADTLRDISDKNQQISKDQVPAQQSRTREQMKQYIILGIITNVLFAFAIIMFFIRDIMRGLNRLADNSSRLARGAALHPVMQGTDEITNLDQVFHDMAAALDEATRNTRSIIEHMPVGLVTFDLHGTVHTVNPRTEELFKIQGEDIVGKNVMSLFSQAQRSEPERFMQELQNRCLNRVSEMRAQSNDGNLFPVEVSINEYSTDLGTQFLASILDITERHEIERLKREFVAMVSHDLRTPLTSVEASLTLLSAGALGDISDEARKTVIVAEREVVRLRGLVNDLLDIAKIESGTMDINFEDIQLKDVISQSADSVRPTAADRQIIIECADTDTIAYADGNRLVQVLVNFLSNAVKYSPDGGTVRVHSQSTPEWDEVRVDDNGPGIAPEYLELIFHRFGQAKGENQKEGTGLGLAIAKTIIEQHGGTLGVDSKVGEGSSFWFRLPARKEVISIDQSSAVSVAAHRI